MAWNKTEIEDAKTELIKLLKPGDTVYTVLRHVSSSGMYRAIDVYKLECKKGKLQKYWLSYCVARALDCRFDEKRDAVGVGGCGMDMGFHLVNSLSYALHGMKSKGADAEEADGKGIPFRPRRGHFRAGYSLEHEWL